MAITYVRTYVRTLRYVRTHVRTYVRTYVLSWARDRYTLRRAYGGKIGAHLFLEGRFGKKNVFGRKVLSLKS